MWVTSLRESRAFPAFCFAVAAVALVVMVDTAPVDVVQEAVQRHVGTVPYDGDELLMQLMQVKTDTDKEGSVAAKKAMRHIQKKIAASKKKSARKNPALIKHNLSEAQHALNKAKTPAQIATAKIKLKAALGDAGMTDTRPAATIAWANAEVRTAKKWARSALAKDTKSLGKASAYTEGDRKVGLLMRKKAERALQAMVDVANKSKNNEMVARERKLRAAGKMKSYDGPIKAAKNAARAAEVAVDKARAAMASTLGTRARIAARHALLAAKNGVHNANAILKMEKAGQNAIDSNRLRSDGARLVGESILHYKARKTFHRASRALKMVNKALDKARANHYAFQMALRRKNEKMAQEKGAKMAHRERKKKRELERKKLGIKTEGAFATYLSRQALKHGLLAKKYAKMSVKEGIIAKKKALEAEEIEEELGNTSGVKQTAQLRASLDHERTAADLASKAAAMEDAVANGGGIPGSVKKMLTAVETKVRNSKAEMLTAAKAASIEAGAYKGREDAFIDLQNYATQRDFWQHHFKRAYKHKLVGILSKLHNKKPRLT